MTTPSPSAIAAALRRREISPKVARGWLMAAGASEEQAQAAVHEWLRQPPRIAARPLGIYFLCAGWFALGVAWSSIAWWLLG